ncbi:MAG: hypothetical protein ABIS34_07980 [Opitutus sp.]
MESGLTYQDPLAHPNRYSAASMKLKFGKTGRLFALRENGYSVSRF